jgi:hypothetical protein
MMALFAAMVLVALVGPTLTARRQRRQFQTIARHFGVQPGSGDTPAAFSATAVGRAFDVEHHHRSTQAQPAGGHYRGPRGHVLITSTPLAGPNWSMHQVDIARRKSGDWISGGKPTVTGDAVFDGRFRVLEDGLPVRNGWLDARTRQAITTFFDSAPLPGPLWIQENRLLFLMQDPWKGIDGAAVQSLLHRQAELADALESTARSRP